MGIVCIHGIKLVELLDQQFKDGKPQTLRYSLKSMLRRISEHKQNREAQQQNPSKQTVSHVVLDDLIEEGCSDQEIVDEINTMILAGHETTASLIYYFLVCISQNPTVQKGCQEEIHEMIVQNPELWRQGKVPLEVFKGELKYIERCLQETLRLFPSVPHFLRQLKSPLDILYDNSKIRIPADTVVAISAYLLHRSEEYYPAPEKFDPDRFLSEEMARRHPYAYLPFSSGPRDCMGKTFALMEAKTFATYLVPNFEFHTVEKIEDIPVIPHVILRHERDFTFIIKKRTAVYSSLNNSTV